MKWNNIFYKATSSSLTHTLYFLYIWSTFIDIMLFHYLDNLNDLYEQYMYNIEQTFRPP